MVGRNVGVEIQLEMMALAQELVAGESGSGGGTPTSGGGLEPTTSTSSIASSSVPYEAISSKSKTPIPVNYLPANGHNHDMKRSDSNSSFQPQTLISGPIPPLPPRKHSGTSQKSTPMASRDSSVSSFQKPDTHSRFDPKSSVYSNSSDSPSHRRSRSIENAGDSNPSSRHSSYSYDDDTLSVASHKASKSTINAMVQANDFNLERPESDAVVEAMFLELMNKRDFKSLPEAAKKQMLAYPISKKWMLIHQDALTEFQNEKKRAQHTKTDENTPEWYVRKLMDNSISTKQLGNLWVSLRTEPVSWVQQFIEAQGQVALSTVLSHINHRNSWNEDVLDREYDLVKCLKALLNLKDGADHAVQTTKCVPALVRSLISPRLSSRKLVTDVLTFLAHWQEPIGHQQVLSALDTMKGHIGDLGRFESWMRMVEQTLDGRGKMGSMVGASEEYRTGGVGMESLLMEYALSTLFLVNVIVQGSPELKVRVHLRSQLKASGLPRIAAKMQQFKYEHINEQIRKYDEAAALDYEDLLNIEREEDIRSMDDPNEIVSEIWSRVKGTSAEGFFLSAMQHFLLVREDPSDEGARMFQLVDALLSHVVMDRISPDMDLANIMNFSVQTLLDRLQTDDQARRALIESKEAYKAVQEANAEREHMRQMVNLGADGMVGRLQKQLDEANEMLNLQRRINENLQGELDDLKQSHVTELQNRELEIRELYLMLKESKERAAQGGEPESQNGIINRERLTSKLEAQLARKKTEYKLEGRAMEVEPSPRLRELRDKMESLQMQARELEVFDFQDEEKAQNELGSSLPESARADLYEQRLLRMKRLKQLQEESGDVARNFSIDEQQSHKHGSATNSVGSKGSLSPDLSVLNEAVPEKAKLVDVGKRNAALDNKTGVNQVTAGPTAEDKAKAAPFLADITRKVAKVDSLDEKLEEEPEKEADAVKTEERADETKAREKASSDDSAPVAPSTGDSKPASFDGPPPPSPPPPPSGPQEFTGAPPPPPPPPPPGGFNGAPPPPPPPPPPAGFNGAPP
ncbi:hypothetical protein TRICI_002007, partial [Trichomonascus ciferrii]